MNDKLDILHQKAELNYYSKKDYLIYLGEILSFIRENYIEQEKYLKINRNYKNNIITVREILKDVADGLSEKDFLLKQSLFHRAYQMLMEKYKGTCKYRKNELFLEGYSGWL